MANNLLEYEDSTSSGKTVYAVARNASGQWWNTATPGFEGYNAANWTSYAIALTEAGASGYFTASTPAFPAGTYAVGIRVQSGGSPATTDTSKGGATAYWDGAAWQAAGDAVASVTAGVTLASNGLDAITAEAAAGGASAVNARQALALILDACASLLSGAGTGHITIQNPGGTATRITATTDASGNRTAISLSPPP